MHRFALFFFTVLILALAGCSEQSQAPPSGPPAMGQVAPDFTLTDLAGRSYTLSQLRGKVVIVNFWATWCPPCRAEMPSMEQMYRELFDEGVVILAVNVEKDGRQTVPKLLAEAPHSFPIVIDDREEVQRRYGVSRFPESFVIRRDGVIDEKIIGAIDWAHPQTVAHFRALARG